MLAVAVLACMLLRDDERIEAGSQEVAGKLVGVHGSAAPEGRNVVSRAVPVQNGATAQPARVEEHTAPARVKVLELARVTADNKAELTFFNFKAYTVNCRNGNFACVIASVYIFKFYKTHFTVPFISGNLFC